jgi:two-component system phosphate regulon response regulator PhoB
MSFSMNEQNKPYVLIVEDEAPLVTLLRYNLEKQGFRVEDAGDGGEAVARITETPPDLLLLDWMLPTMSGIEVCRQLRRRPATRTLPIIMLTARAEDQDAVRGLDTGADDYITKPFSTEALIARIRALLRRSGTVPTKLHRTACCGTAGRCIWAPPNSGCWNSSCATPNACSHVRTC